MPERLALAGGDVGAVRAGRREDGQADRLDDGDEQRARGVRQAADLGHRLEQAEEVRLGGDDAGDRAVRVGEHPLQGGQVGRAGGRAVGDQRDLVELEAALEVGLASSGGSAGWTPRETRTRSRRVARQVISAASAVAAAPS